MVHPVVRSAYAMLPSPVREGVKSAFKAKVEARRATRVLENMLRDTVVLANVVPAVADASPAGDDGALVCRLVAAYRLADAEGHVSGASMWTEFFQTLHGNLHQTFMADDMDASASILRDPGRTNLFYGFDQLSADLLEYAASQRWRQANANATADGLVRLAESIGARPYPYTEALSTGYAMRATVDPVDCLRSIEETLGFTIPVPNPFPNEHGLATPAGVMAYRVPQAIYQAHRIRQLTHGIENPSVLEIGGGLGRTAFYARQLGITDYTIVDLPLSSLSQGNFLGRVLGPEQVAVLGEPEINEAARTKLLSPAAFLGSQRRYDLVVNIDSMTEMSREVATAYIRHISANADRFLSINHESNPFTVRELLLEQKLTRPVPRTPYPMRDGYVEEIALLG